MAHSTCLLRCSNLPSTLGRWPAVDTAQPSGRWPVVDTGLLVIYLEWVARQVTLIVTRTFQWLANHPRCPMSGVTLTKSSIKHHVASRVLGKSLEECPCAHCSAVELTFDLLWLLLYLVLVSFHSSYCLHHPFSSYSLKPSIDTSYYNYTCGQISWGRTLVKAMKVSHSHNKSKDISSFHCLEKMLLTWACPSAKQPIKVIYMLMSRCRQLQKLWPDKTTSQ